MKRKEFPGTGRLHVLTHVHLDAETPLSVDVIMEDVPAVTIGQTAGTSEVVLFFQKGASLRRFIDVLVDLERGFEMAGVSWEDYVEGNIPAPQVRQRPSSRRIWPDAGFRLAPEPSSKTEA